MKKQATLQLSKLRIKSFQPASTRQECEARTINSYCMG